VPPVFPSSAQNRAYSRGSINSASLKAPTFLLPLHSFAQILQGMVGRRRQNPRTPFLNRNQPRSTWARTCFFAGLFWCLNVNFVARRRVFCRPRFFGKSLKSAELNRIPGLKLTNRPSSIVSRCQQKGNEKCTATKSRPLPHPAEADRLSCTFDRIKQHSPLGTAPATSLAFPQGQELFPVASIRAANLL